MQKLLVGLLIGLWWICSIWANVYSKEVFFDLKEFAIQLSFAQTSTGACIMGLLFQPKLFKDKYFAELIQRISIKVLFMLSLLHALGNLFTNVSMESQDVTFAYTIKAAEPLFIIYFSRKIGKHEPSSLYLAAIPVMLGVAIASLVDVFPIGHFNGLGFIATVLATSCFAYRNVSIKNLNEKDNLGIFFLVSCGSSIILALIHTLKSTFHDPPPENEKFPDAFLNIICAAVLHCAYNIFSFVVLGQVNPLTHSIINLVKRGAVLFVATASLATPVNALHIIGMLTTLLGGVLFSLLKRSINQKKPSQPTENQSEDKNSEPATVSHRPSIRNIIIIICFLLLAAAASKPSPGLKWILWEEAEGDLIPCSTEHWSKHEEDQIIWDSVKIDKIDKPLIVMLGYSALSPGYHFDQFGSSYVADREIRKKFGEHVTIIPISPSMQQNTVDGLLPLADRIVYNLEDTKFDTALNYLNKIRKLDVPTFILNAGWNPTEDTEDDVVSALQDNPALEQLVARDYNSYVSMQADGLTQAVQGADLTFLLPHQFSCDADEYLTKKNEFWSYSGKLKVVVTMGNGDSNLQQSLLDAVDLMIEELEGDVHVVSMVDDIRVGMRDLEHLSEESIYEAMWLLKNADVVITGRYHCATMARIAGVPAVLVPGNSFEIQKLAEMLDSPAYPYVGQPVIEGTWAQQIWTATKSAVAYAKEFPLEDDGVLARLHGMAKNNFPIEEKDPITNTKSKTITVHEMERELNFQITMRNLTETLSTSQEPQKIGISYDTNRHRYVIQKLL